MKDYDPSIVCDYVTLFIKDADNHPESDMNDGKCVWNIPYNAYYFKDRGSVCLMSIVDGNISKVSDMIVMTQKGFNGSTPVIDAFDNSIRDLAILGSFTHNLADGDNYVTEYLSPQKIKLLTACRPSQIQLYFYDMNKNAVDFTQAAGNEKGHITLKFEYVNPEELEKNIVNQEYLPAF